MSVRRTAGTLRATAKPSAAAHTRATLVGEPNVDAEVQARVERLGGRAPNNCEVCGNEYDKAFELIVAGRSHVFDCFECAIHAMAPRCSHCGCPIIGHGMEHAGAMYCCAHCAQAHGVGEMKDRS